MAESTKDALIRVHTHRRPLVVIAESAENALPHVLAQSRQHQILQTRRQDLVRVAKKLGNPDQVAKIRTVNRVRVGRRINEISIGGKTKMFGEASLLERR
jgi:hypothetical protein